MFYYLSGSWRCSLQKGEGWVGVGSQAGRGGNRLTPNPSLPLGSGHRPIQEKPKEEGILDLGRKEILLDMWK